MKKSTLENVLQKENFNTSSIKPIIFDLKKEKDRIKLGELLLKNNKIQEIHDQYEDQLKEYFSILNPTLVFQQNFEKKFVLYKKNLIKKSPLWQQGRWVYFPWLYTLVHILEEKAFFLVRTARNRNLITTDEQQKFYNAVIGIAGLSVGNSVALAIALQGGARHIKLADFDRLALSNTNRIRCGVESIGESKCEITAKQIYSLNPYAHIEIFPEGLTPQNISTFFNGTKKLDVVIDEIDNLAVKCLIREQAKKHKIPVVMAADNGDNGVVDIERYDQDPHMEYFHGRMGDVSYKKLIGLNKFEIGSLILKHVGPENVPIRMIQSLGEMGKTLVSWPQLGGAALLNGSAVAYCIRKIVTGQPLENNRALISLDEKLDLTANRLLNRGNRNLKKKTNTLSNLKTTVER